MLYNMVFIKVLVYLSSATCTMNLLNPKNGSKLPSRDFANPPNVRRHFIQTSVNKKNFQKMNYRNHLIKSVQNLIETEQILFTNALNLCMFGELRDSDDAFEENDEFSFNLELLKSVDDLNVKKIVEIIESLQIKTEYLINVNKITETELNNEYNL